MFGSLIPERSGEATCMPCMDLALAIRNTFTTTQDDLLTDPQYMTDITAMFDAYGVTMPGDIDDATDVLTHCGFTFIVIEGSGSDPDQLELILDQDADRKRTICPDGSLSFTNDYGNRSYRFGFNGKEDDKETGTQDYGMRIYNPGLGRFLSLDPLFKGYPHYTPYSFAGNKPIWAIDLDGKEEFYVTFYLNSAGALFMTKIKIVGPYRTYNDVGTSGAASTGQLYHYSVVTYTSPPGVPAGAGPFNATVNYIGSSETNLTSPNLNVFSALSPAQTAVMNQFVTDEITNNVNPIVFIPAWNESRTSGVYLAGEGNPKFVTRRFRGNAAAIPGVIPQPFRLVDDGQIRTITTAGVAIPPPNNSVALPETINAVPPVNLRWWNDGVARTFQPVGAESNEISNANPMSTGVQQNFNLQPSEAERNGSIGGRGDGNPANDTYNYIIN